MSAFPTLLSPISIGPMALRNRVVMSPMETQYGSPEGLPTERAIAYYEARARGGVALVTLGACSVDARHKEVPNSLHFASDDVVEAHRALTERVHAHGAKVQPQLAHAGPDGLAPQLHGIDSLGPSAIQSYLTGTASREITPEELAAVARAFGAAARRARLAGYDGVELHAAHGYMLLGSFLSPWRNARGDDYTGRTREGRVRAVVQVVRAIKEEAGDDFPLTLRVSGYERIAAGRPIHDTQRIAPALVEAGVDAFHVSGGVIDRLVTQMVNGAHDPDALNVAAATAVRQVVEVPVIVVGRIHDPATAERVLAEGGADLVAMGRPLLADPELVAKARDGRADRIRRCISCQNCIDAMELRFAMDCAVNPSTGRETQLDPTRPAGRPRSVVVVGGGPAGLEAARIAALRGHRVTLYESSPFLGGALVQASVVHPENEPFLRFLRAELARLPVAVRLGTSLSPEAAVAAGADAVVVATGGRVVPPALPGDELPHVVDASALRALVSGAVPERAAALPARLVRGARLLRGAGRALGRPGAVRAATRAWMPLGRRVAVVGADLAALELAEFLAERGRRVRVLAAAEEIAPEVGPKRRGEHMLRLDRAGVSLNTGVEIARIRRDGVVLRLVSGAESLVPADSVVLAGEVRADTSFYDAVKDRVPEAHAIGDCTGLGLVRKATLEAAQVACAL